MKFKIYLTNSKHSKAYKGLSKNFMILKIIFCKKKFCQSNETDVQKQGKKEMKLTDKPGSVLTLRQVTVIHLGALLLMRSSNLPADDASHAIVSLFGLAADGGYRVSPVSTQVRNFRCSQVEPTRLCGPIPRLIPYGFQRTAVSRHPALRSPDFPLS